MQKVEKQCSHCKGWKPILEFRNDITKTCNSCYEYLVIYRRENVDQYKKSQLKYKENNPEKYKDSQRKSKKRYRIKYPEKRRDEKNKNQKRWRDELHDLYIKTQIYNSIGVPGNKIPIKFLEYKRLQIQLKRKIYSYGREKQSL